MKVETKIIVPAAGYGTRVGMPMSKELFTNAEGLYLIDKAIKIGEVHQIPVHIITRKEKINLIEYLKQFSHVTTQIINPSREWPDTILQSKPFWSKKNLLILPDTTWSPMNIEIELLNDLSEFDLSIGAFKENNLRTWGAFDTLTSSYTLIEKPVDQNLESFLAWGLIAFKNEIGSDLFNLILESTIDHQLKKTHFNFNYRILDSFIDLTRGN